MNGAGIGVVVSLFAAGTAWAQSPDDIKAKSSQVQEKAGEVSKACGGKLTATVDWKAFAPHFHDELSSTDLMNSCSKADGLQAAQCAIDGCEIVLNALAALCSNTYGDAGRGAVSRLTAVSCTYDKSTKRDVGLALDGTTVRVKYNGLAKDTGSAGDWLMRNLPAPVVPGIPPTSILERVKIEERNGELKEKVQAAMTACGTKIDVSMDWAAFVPHFHDASTDEICNKPDTAQATTCAESACGQAMEAIEGVCRDPAGKKMIASKVHAVRCTWDKSLPDRKLGVDLKAGVLTFRYDGRVRGVDEQATNFLRKVK
jgi:hypothetical protein